MRTRLLGKSPWRNLCVENSATKVLDYLVDTFISTIFLDGFGFTVPRREGLRTICTFWNSSLFPGQARKGTIVMTSLVAGENDGDPMEASDDLLVQTVQAENAAILGITGAPIDRMV
jgi:oxygen-dependent protoporphyrinogen oxidase